MQSLAINEVISSTLLHSWLRFLKPQLWTFSLLGISVTRMKTNTKIKEYLHHINPCRCREPCVSFKVGDQTLAWPVLSPDVLVKCWKHLLLINISCVFCCFLLSEWVINKENQIHLWQKVANFHRKLYESFCNESLTFFFRTVNMNDQDYPL